MSSHKRKTTDIVQNCESKRQKHVKQANPVLVDPFLSTVTAYILQAGIQKMRMHIFETQLSKFGGKLSKNFDSHITHLVVDDKMEPERILKLLKIETIPSQVTVVKSGWLSTCFREKRMTDIDSFVLVMPAVSKEEHISETKDRETGSKHNANVDTNVEKSMYSKVGVMFGHKKTLPGKNVSDDEESDYHPSDGEEQHDEEPSSSREHTLPKPKGNWVCTQSSKVQLENVNKHITDKLEEMVRTYETTNDKWRAFGYQKAIQVLRRQSKPISSFEEATALPGIGKRLAEKIWEIAESGELRKLNELRSSDNIKVIELFSNVWGAGPTTARAWYQQGFRSLADLREKANLTHQQKVGVNHYDDFLDRMPREEAGEIEKVVCTAAESLLDGVIAQACGSYRRGKKDCGDVDVLVTHPDGKSHRGMFAKLLALLKQQGFLTDDLVTAEDSGNQKKYLGVCKLPGDGRKYRRLDIIVVPYDEYACALVYFTGSAHFNRSLRHLAKKMGMSLSEHSLNVGVVRNGTEKIYEGTPVPTPTEESVLTKLGVPYRPPEERDH